MHILLYCIDGPASSCSSRDLLEEVHGSPKPKPHSPLVLASHRPQLKAAGCTRHKAGPKAPSGLSRTGLCHPQLSTEGQEAHRAQGTTWMAFPTAHTAGQRHPALASRRPPGVWAPCCPQLTKESEQSELAGRQQPFGFAHTRGIICRLLKQPLGHVDTMLSCSSKPQNGQLERTALTSCCWQGRRHEETFRHHQKLGWAGCL